MSRATTPRRRVVLLRHGRTEWNAIRRVQGQADVELDETGHSQAEQVASVLARLEPAVLWSSDLMRARTTAGYLSEATGLRPTYDARLREYSLGVREGSTHEEYVAAAPQEYAEFRRGNFDVVPEGEREVQVRERMCAVLGDLLAGLEEGETAIAVSHGAAVRVLVAAVLALPDGGLHQLSGLDNCGWVVLEESEQTDTLRLSAYNRTA